MTDVALPTLHPRQREVFEHPARFKVCVCGRRWGKTRLGIVAGFARALAGGRVWWVAPTYSQAGVAWRLARPLAAQVPGAARRDADHALRFPGGGEFWFKSGDRFDNLRGEGLDLLVLDEADYLAAAVWEQALRPALADRKGGALFLSTPAVEGGWFHQLFERGRADATGAWASWQLPSASNPHLDPAELEAARRAVPQLVFRREFGAEFVSSAGARVQRDWLRTARPPADLAVVLGVDLAVSERASADYTAVVALGQAPDGALWVLDARRDRLPFHRALELVKAAAADWSPVAVGVEDVAFQRAAVTELLRTTQLPVRPVRPQGDKVARFAPLEARYEQRLVAHAPGLPAAFVDELLSFPVGAHDDFADALSTAFAVLAVVDRAPAVTLDPDAAVSASERWTGFEGRGF